MENKEGLTGPVYDPAEVGEDGRQYFPIPDGTEDTQKDIEDYDDDPDAALSSRPWR